MDGQEKGSVVHLHKPMDLKEDIRLIHLPGDRVRHLIESDLRKRRVNLRHINAKIADNDYKADNRMLLNGNTTTTTKKITKNNETTTNAKTDDKIKNPKGLLQGTEKIDMVDNAYENIVNDNHDDHDYAENSDEELYYNEDEEEDEFFHGPANVNLTKNRTHTAPHLVHHLASHNKL